MLQGKIMPLEPGSLTHGDGATEGRARAPVQTLLSKILLLFSLPHVCGPLGELYSELSF